MRVILKTTNLNPIPEIVFQGTDKEFRKEGFFIVSNMAADGYTVVWHKDTIVFERGTESVFFLILNVVFFRQNLKEPAQSGYLIK